MLNISRVSNLNTNYAVNGQCNNSSDDSRIVSSNENNEKEYKNVSAEVLKAYHPSFTSFWSSKDDTKLVLNPNNELTNIEDTLKFNAIVPKLDKNTLMIFENLNANGILGNKNSNDGSTVLDNLYKIIAEPRIRGLNDKLILEEVIKALDNPYSITQKFGDIPDNVADEIEKTTGEAVPEFAKNVVSSSCVAASMEFNLADRYPAEFARFAADLSGKKYCVYKNIKFSDFSENFVDGIWKLREFNTKNKVNKNWKNVEIKIEPDRNAIIRARIQSSYKDYGERSCVDVLMQSAILNFASQNTYDSIKDERTGKYNPDKTGLTDFEKNFAEQIIFETPKFSIIYQDLDSNGKLKGYNCTHEETKKHILKSLEQGQNVIIGYTYVDEKNEVKGGHEITIVDYEKDSNGKGYFICNDTDDDIDEPIKIYEDKLLPLIHHAGISKEALNANDVIIEPWRERLNEYHQLVNKNKNKNAA